MEKIHQIRHDLDKIDFLIGQMQEEIKLLRNIAGRYHEKYGSEIKNGVFDVAENISFYIEIDDDDIVSCKKHDSLKSGIKSNYEKISEKLRQLDGK